MAQAAPAASATTGGEADLPRVSLGAKSHCLGHASRNKALSQANTQQASPEQTAEQVALHIPWECWENPAGPSQPLYTGSPYNNSRELGCATTQGDDGSERLRTSPRICSCQMTPPDPTSRPKWFEIKGSRGEMTGCASTCYSGPVPSLKSPAELSVLVIPCQLQGVNQGVQNEEG